MKKYDTSIFEFLTNSTDLEKVNSVSSTFKNIDNPFLNSYFHHFFFKYEIPLKRQLEGLRNKKREKVLIKLSSKADFNLNQLVLALSKTDGEASIKKDHMYFVVSLLTFWEKYISVTFIILAYSCYQVFEFLRIPTFKNKLSNNESAILSFCHTSYKKLRKIYPSEHIIYYGNEIFDELTIPLSSLFSRRKRMSLIFKVIKNVIHSVRSTYKNAFFRNNIAFIKYLSKRIFQTYQIEVTLEAFFSQRKIEKVVSGLKDERYSFILNQLSKKHNFKTISYPHGLAYSIKYPHGIFGQTYYCFSKIEQKYLSHLYDNHFISEHENLNIDEDFITEKIVFFTDSRNPQNDKKIIDLILETIPQKKFLIKLHPNENRDFFKDYSPITTDNFKTAISKSLVISRSSTVLIEALSNNSKPISVILNDVDKFNKRLLYPALMDSRIIEIQTERDLINFIKKGNY